jgi:hypothetical protein
MTYKTGVWGEQAKERSRRRSEYFKNRHKQKNNFNTQGLGSFGEYLGLKILNGSTLERKSEYDILWKNKKIEVKTASFQERKNNNYIKQWVFNTDRQKGKTDYFLLILTEKDKKTILKIYLIPDDQIMSKSKLTISENQLSLYEKYMVEMR